MLIAAHSGVGRQRINRHDMRSIALCLMDEVPLVHVRRQQIGAPD